MPRARQTTWRCAALATMLTGLAATAAADGGDAVAAPVALTPALTLLPLPDANVLVLSGADGAVVVDGAMAANVPGLLEALSGLDAASPRMLIATHWHEDHTGANAALRERGAGVLAHANAQRRLARGQTIAALNRRVAAAPDAAHATLTFRRAITLYTNGERVIVRHLPRAHTDGDVAVFFERANVLHTGDIFFSHGYPFIDTSSGGSLRGTIDAVAVLLGLCDEATRIVPGHGPVASCADLAAYGAMLGETERRVIAMLDARYTGEAVVTAQPLRDFDARWGNGPVSPARFLRIVVEDLAAQ